MSAPTSPSPDPDVAGAGQLVEYVCTEPIRTDRLLLRVFRDEDLDDISDFESRPDVVRYLSWRVYDRSELQRRLTERVAMDHLGADGDAMLLAVERRDTGQVIGHVMLMWASAVHLQGEIGYLLHPDHQGHGYATEGTLAMLDLGFRLGMHRICGRADPRNEASVRLLGRLGMRHEGHLVQNEFVKGEWRDDVVYAILAAEWRAARGFAGLVPV